MGFVDYDVKITGTLVWYYSICHRETWLMAHEINPETENPFLELGRLIQEESYPREKKEFQAPGMKIDLLRDRDGQLIVGEIKKSSRFVEAARMQVTYYLWRLRQMGVEARGELLVPKERRRIPIELTEELQSRLEETLQDIQKVIALETPPPPVQIPFCRSCAYAEFCWG
jgi:CRISPR-associated exonuclease Cas4